MLNQQEVKEFFDRLAPNWDNNMVVDDNKMYTILKNAEIGNGSKVLDAACGTGVVFPYYKAVNVGEVTAIDLSCEMVKIAKEKYAKDLQSGWLKVVCGDVETTDIGKDYDAIVIYNAFPHFPNPESLISHLSQLLIPGGILTVAHGSSRAAIDAHHNGMAKHVSNGLMEADELAKIFSKYLTVETVLTNDQMYQVAGRRK